LPPLDAIRIVAQSLTSSTGTGPSDDVLQYAQARFFHMEAFGKFVPEPNASVAMWAGVVVAVCAWRARQGANAG
ncbi:MAG: hypothetical protein AAGF97_13170, partial [Planctomycetota bacterium]